VTKVRSPLIWFGGKSKLAQLIISFMPPHQCYVEPFGGAAHVLTQKSPVLSEIYNDIDDDVVNFLLVLRDDPEKLAKALSSLPYSRSLYETWKWSEKPKNKFDRAVRWFYLNRAGDACGNNHKSGWRHGKSVNPARDYYSVIETLDEFANRFKNVMIECRDFRKIIQTYDSEDTLFYIDPPYRGNENRYKGGFTDQDHIDLANLLETIKGKALVSYYQDELIDQLYRGWRRIEIDSYNFSQVIKEQERPKRTEILFLNYDDGQMSIFDYGVI